MKSNFFYASGCLENGKKMVNSPNRQTEPEFGLMTRIFSTRLELAGRRKGVY